MDINLNDGTTVMDLDQLIHRTLQEHYLELQPPAMVWGSIQRHLAHRKFSVSEHTKRELQSNTTSTITQGTPKGRKEN